ncbi:hypothetical protein LR48_Vigan10g238600 [Vigna angularis]|uniref:Uncharacterized protein n=1 Tax=Phaseolus angularis TaxID=3914 RepID=A0A0L9VP41_PHAAN|nr:hypothetical protein LR48_Vigan10g238600 [Vigna angularis]
MVVEIEGWSRKEETLTSIGDCQQPIGVDCVVEEDWMIGVEQGNEGRPTLIPIQPKHFDAHRGTFSLGQLDHLRSALGRYNPFSLDHLDHLRSALSAKGTLSVELVKYCYGDRGIAGSSLVCLRKCSEEKVILREVFGRSVASYVKIQRRCCFISCGIKRVALTPMACLTCEHQLGTSILVQLIPSGA